MIAKLGPQARLRSRAWHGRHEVPGAAGCAARIEEVLVDADRGESC
ncbi:hypothetical protein ACFV4G_42605 [Kitasatospora sp. NPDC059747]